MKVKTNAGEVELTADMGRPGMVLQWHNVNGPATLTLHDGWRAVRLWGAGVDTTILDLFDRRDVEFLGCDPTIAAREDVERYGVAPGIDAGAHGFARMRDGGAVDVRRPESVVAGMVWESAGHRLTVPGANVRIRRPDGSTFTEHLGAESPDAIGWRFIGLDARYASPEDVRRLCCGARHVYIGAETMESACTLAIGDHAEHEDIAQGVRWPAENAMPSPTSGTPAWIIAMVADDGYACTVDCAAPGPATVNVKVHGAPWSYCYGLQLRLADQMWGHVDVSVEPAAEPQGFNPPGTYRCLGCDECVPHGMPHRCASDECVPEPPGGWRTPEQIDREVAERGRRNREAPLMALVAAVPLGLDPVGWRAAVLAMREQDPATFDGNIGHVGTAMARLLRDFVRTSRMPETFFPAAMFEAYDRAIAPQGPRPVPERRRSPGLPLDVDTDLAGLDARAGR